MTKAPTTRPVWHGPPGLKKLLVPIGLLAPHPSNPRKHDLPSIMASLKDLGQQKPIVVVPPGRVNAEFQTIVAGHGTTFAARELGWSHIAAVESDLEDADIERFVLADNRASDRAGYDDEVLARLLGEVQDRGGLDGTGYTRDDLDDLLKDLHLQSRRNQTRSPDYVPPVPSDPASKRGEVYELGDHLLMCGDCTSDDDIVVLLADKKPSVLYTDPPYGIALDTRFSEMHGANSYGPGGKDYAPVIGDDVPYDPTPVLERFDKVREQFWWGGDYYRQHLPLGGSWLVWDKRYNESGMDLDKLIGAGFELCWSRQAHKREVLRITWGGFHGMQGEDTKERIHPTQKPVALAEWVLQRYAKEGPVLDVYAGSGSALIAAERLAIPCLAMEIDPAYCDVIRQRYADLTGQPELAP